MFCYKYPRLAVTVDAAIFRKTDHAWHILLVRRGTEPFKGIWALPGGFVNMEETLEEAIKRELEEETGIRGIELKQLYTFSEIDRDPRHRTISTVFYGRIVDPSMTVEAGDDASETSWFCVDQLPELAFDHNQIIQYAIQHIILE